MGRPKKNINPLIGQRIREARNNTFIDVGGRKKKMTQKALADRLFVSLQAVKNWEQGINSVDDSNLMRISKICNVDYLWLKCLDSITIMQTSKAILDSTNLNNQGETPNLTVREESKSLALIYSLQMCGYTLNDVVNKAHYCSYMESSIKSAIEFYMENINTERN